VKLYHSQPAARRRTLTSDILALLLILLLGLLVFLLPTAVYLWQVGPRQALAMRAAFGLPFGRLLRHTPDPIGDLVKDRYDPLLEALYEDAEMRTP
jgi:hypothetical protein